MTSSKFGIRTCLLFFVAVSFAHWAGVGTQAAEPKSTDEQRGHYGEGAVDTAVTRLLKALDRGEKTLKRDAGTGYLRALLEELKVPISSQLLVFSKTSSQRDQVSPATPRALFFNDSVYVAWLPESPRLEVAAIDPASGPIFYNLDQTQTPGVLTPDRRCLECHATARTLGVPGLIVRSFRTEANGDVDILTGSPMETHNSPISERWGGWYVTGKHGNQTHSGNIFGAEAWERHEKDRSHGGNVTDLTPYFDVGKYPAQTSDIVALLLLDHQAHMINLLTRLNTETRRVLREGGSLRSTFEAAEETLKYLLFVDEYPLAAPVQGGARFAADFEGLGPKDGQGRSLRQLDLRTRLLKYPCSYLVYSDSFEGLEPEAKRHLYRRLWTILSGEDQTGAYSKLSPETRLAIREILIQTKKDLPAYWKL